MRGAAGKERRVRATIAERHAKALRRSEDDVGTKVPWCLDDRQCQKIGRDDGETANRLNGLDGRTDVAHPPAASRIADEGAEISFVTRRVGILDPELDPDRLGAGFQNRQRLRVGVGIDAEDRSLCAMRPKRHRHPLGGGSGFVKKRAVRDVHAGQLDHHRLEIEDRLETPLRNLRLVRGVGGIPGRVLQHIAENHRRCVAAVISHADERGADLVHRRKSPHFVKRLGLGHGSRQIHLAMATDIARHHLAKKRLE